jgi:hypothetical protein
MLLSECPQIISCRLVDKPSSYVRSKVARSLLSVPQRSLGRMPSCTRMLALSVAKLMDVHGTRKGGALSGDKPCKSIANPLMRHAPTCVRSAMRSAAFLGVLIFEGSFHGRNDGMVSIDVFEGMLIGTISITARTTRDCGMCSRSLLKGAETDGTNDGRRGKCWPGSLGYVCQQSVPARAIALAEHLDWYLSQARKPIRLRRSMSSSRSHQHIKIRHYVHRTSSLQTNLPGHGTYRRSSCQKGAWGGLSCLCLHRLGLSQVKLRFATVQYGPRLKTCYFHLSLHIP